MSETLHYDTLPLIEDPSRSPEAEVFLDIPKAYKDLGDTAVKNLIEVADPNTIERSANFQGNWTNIALERMKSHDFKTKFNEWVETSAAALPDTLTPLTREKITASQYITRINEFDAAHENVGSHITYGPASEHNHAPSTLGTSADFGENAVLFSDAPLNNRQKDIIVAHEMFHSLVDSQGAAAKEVVREAFDTNEISRWNEEQKNTGSDKRTPIKYMTSPDELMARMAQVKNYYGMHSNESFTQMHLDYARSHYVEDTGLDNNMTLFFRMAKDEVFIGKMNSLPV